MFFCAIFLLNLTKRKTLARFLIAFYNDETGNSQKLIEAETETQALEVFFNEGVPVYSADDEGFAFFKDDFFDAQTPMGAIYEIQE